MNKRIFWALVMVITVVSPILAANDGKVIYQKYPQIEEQLGYSQAVQIGTTLYISGTVGVDNFGILPSDLKSQLELVYRNIGMALKRFNAGPANIVMERLYTTDIAALSKSENLSVRKKFYAGEYPAATWVEVKHLYEPSALVEVEVVAEIK